VLTVQAWLNTSRGPDASAAVLLLLLLLLLLPPMSTAAQAPAAK
jgi:hypothetical protein